MKRLALLALVLGGMVGWMLPRKTYTPIDRAYDKAFMGADDPGVLYRNWADTKPGQVIFTDENGIPLDEKYHNWAYRGSADLIAQQRQRESGNVTNTPWPVWYVRNAAVNTNGEGET